MKKSLPIYLLLLAPLALLSAGSKDYSKLLNSHAAFTENKGQLRGMDGRPVDNVLAYYSVPGLNVYITSKGVTYVMQQFVEDPASRPNLLIRNEKKSKINYSRVDVDLEGAVINAGNLKFTGESGWKSNYYKSADGKGQLDVVHYKTLTISNIYPGIDWVWKCNGSRKLEYDFVVHPGADANLISMNYKYADLTPGSNQLKIAAKYGSIIEGPLQAHNQRGNAGIKYRFDKAGKSIQFDAGNYDRTTDLVIDPPLTLEWSAQFGGSFNNGLRGVATDTAGYIYLAGYTNSADFPTQNSTSGAYFDSTYNGASDAVILKIDSNETLLWSTFMGGTGNDYANSVTVDPFGDIFVVGSAQAGFPIVNLSGAYNDSVCIRQDAFISAFKPDLKLYWSTFYGGDNDNEALKVFATGNDNIYVCGYTSSTGSTFPTLGLPGYQLQSANAGGNDAFVLQFGTFGNYSGKLIWATMYGGSGDDYATGVTIDASASVLITGYTSSDDLPVNNMIGSNYQQTHNAGGIDGFIVRYASYYNYMQYATYVGGAGTDYLTDISAEGTSGSVVLTGGSNSTNFPLHKQGFAYNQSALAGTYDAVIMQFDDSLGLKWSTYYGGTDIDIGTAVTCDKNGRIYLTGFTFSTNFPLDSPTYAGAYYQSTNAGESDGFLAGFSSLGARFWSTYKGDSCYEYPNDIAYNNKFNQFYIVGDDLLNCQSLPDTGQVNGSGYSTVGFCWGFDNGGAAAGGGAGGPPGCFDLGLSNKVPCPGQCNGIATVSYSGGTAPYQVIWSNGDTNSTTSLCAGAQWVEVQDAAGCVGQNTFYNEPLYVETFGDDIGCSGYGEADAFAEGGNGNLNYIWSDGTTTSYDEKITSPGTYAVTVTDGAGCSATSSAVVNAIDYSQSYSIQVVQNPTCGQSNGVLVCLYGEPPFYDYPTAVNWDVYSLYGTGGYSTYGDTLYNVGFDTIYYLEGIYNCYEGELYPVMTSFLDSITGIFGSQVRQPYGCSDSLGTIDVEPVAFDLYDLNNSYNFSYTWSDGASSYYNELENAPPGIYSVTITDGYGCTTSLTDTIIPATIPAFGFSTGSSAASSCLNNDGKAWITIDSGQAPFTIDWSNYGYTIGDTLARAQGGLYNVTVTDGAGCNLTHTVLINQTPQLSDPQVDAVTSACNGQNTGSVFMSVDGGEAPLTFLWNTGDTSQNLFNLPAGAYDVIVTDAAGCSTTGGTTVPGNQSETLSLNNKTITCYGDSTGVAWLVVNGGTPPYSFAWSSGASSDTASGLGAGTYSVLVTDNNGCPVSDSISLVQPDPLSVIVNASNISCYNYNDGSIGLSASGGTPGYNYLWDNNNNGSSNAGLPAGTYNCTITDANACSTTENISLTQPDSLSVSASVETSCDGTADGSISLSVSGGTPGYLYLWNNDAIVNTISNLNTGTYTCTITDNNGCSTVHSVSISQPPALVVNTDTVNITCYGYADGSITLDVSGGTPAYRFQWSNNNSGSADNNLAAGTYVCTITDAGGCSMVDYITLGQPDGFQILVNSKNIACYDSTTGHIALTVTGGTPGYTYQWNTSATDTLVSNLTAGNYTCTITDATGCSMTKTVLLTQPDSLTFNLQVNKPSCFDSINGSIIITGFGGTPTYRYQWNNNSTSTTLANLAPGAYSCTVTDAANCTVSNITLLTQPDSLIAQFNEALTTCGSANGSINIESLNGATPPYNLHWSNGDNGRVIGSLATGLYSVTITDGNGCTYIYSDSVPCVTGIENIAADNMFSVYPVPASNYLYITSAQADNYELLLRDVTGRVIQHLYFTQSTILDVASYARGIYLAEIYNRNNALLFVKKVVLQ